MAARFTYLQIIAFLYMTVAATTLAQEKSEEKQKEDAYLEKEKDYWKQTFANMEIPPAINCSLSSAASIELTEFMNVITEADLTKSIPKGISPDMSESDRKALLKSVSEAAKDKLAKKSSSGGDKQKILEVIASAGDSKPQQDSMSQEIKDRTGPPKSAIWSVGKSQSGDLYNDAHDESVATLFFQGEKLQPGTKLTLDFSPSKNNAPFIDDAKLDKTGVLSAGLILDILDPTTNDADISIEVDTLNTCEQPSMKGDNKVKTCATSLESMVNFTMSQIGKEEIRPATTWITKEVVDEQTRSPSIEFTIEKIMTMRAVHTVGCAKMSFPIALYYCLPLPKSVTYTVSLVGSKNGIKFKAPVVCHEDTSTWNPQSWIFKTLQSKPGASKVCHFLAAHDIVWMPKKEQEVAA